MFYGSEGFGTQLLRGEPASSFADAQSAVGRQYYIGGRDGALGSTRVMSIEGTGCQESDFTLKLADDAPRHLFVAYAKPLEFVPLARWPTAKDKLVPMIEPVVRNSGGRGAVIIDQIWRLKGSDGYRFVAVAHSMRDLEEGGFGQPGDFDGIFLFKDDAEDTALLDHDIVVVNDPGGWRRLPFPFAAAVDAKDQRLELFVYFAYYEGEEVIGYDIGGGQLAIRTRGSCSL